MLVSIITVCFNSEKYIEQTIQSVISQTYQPIEYIIIDGQSTDSTVAIIERYVRQYPEQIQYVSERDSGIYNAMNKGLKQATGELIGIINSDDWYDQTAVQTAVTAYQKGGPAVYHGIQRTYRDEVLVGLQCTSSNQLHRQMVEHPTCFVPREFYDQDGMFDETYRYVADYEFMLRLQQKKRPFVMLEEVMANFREGGASHKVEAVWENYEMWVRYGLLSKRMYWYRRTMDQLKLYAGRGHAGK